EGRHSLLGGPAFGSWSLVSSRSSGKDYSECPRGSVLGSSVSSELVRQTKVKHIRCTRRPLWAGHSTHKSPGFELPVAPLKCNSYFIAQLSEIAGPSHGIS